MARERQYATLGAAMVFVLFVALSTAQEPQAQQKRTINGAGGAKSIEELEDLMSKDALHEVTELQVVTDKEPCGGNKELGSKPGDWVAIHYVGRVAKTGKIFDTSMQAQKPIQFRIGGREVIPGLESGVNGMCVGEKRRIFVPPHLGYGEEGYPPVIPPDSTIVFDVNLMKISQQPLGGRESPSFLSLLLDINVIVEALGNFWWVLLIGGAAAYLVHKHHERTQDNEDEDDDSDSNKKSK